MHAITLTLIVTSLSLLSAACESSAMTETVHEAPKANTVELTPSPTPSLVTNSTGAATHTSAQKTQAKLNAPTPSTSQATTTQIPAAKATSAIGEGVSVRAQELLARARQALGGDAKLQAVRSFSASGTFRRVSDNQDQSGNLELSILMSDKLKLIETLKLIADLELTRVKALNGDQSWADMQTGGGNAQVKVMRRQNNAQQAVANQLQDLRDDYTRYLLAFLLTSSSANAEFSYAGEAEAADGRAYVLDVKMPDRTPLKLFLDKRTHLPLMLSYRGITQRTNMVRSSGGSQEDVDKLIKGGQPKSGVGKESDIQMYLSDYRSVDGILLPHIVTRSVDGKPYEEWQVNKFRINPQDLKPQFFEKKQG